MKNLEVSHTFQMPLNLEETSREVLEKPSTSNMEGKLAEQFEFFLAIFPSFGSCC